MHLLHIDGDYIDTRMTVWDFLRSCEWVDAYIEANKPKRGR